MSTKIILVQILITFVAYLFFTYYNSHKNFELFEITPKKLYESKSESYGCEDILITEDEIIKTKTTSFIGNLLSIKIKFLDKLLNIVEDKSILIENELISETDEFLVITPNEIDYNHNYCFLILLNLETQHNEHDSISSELLFYPRIVDKNKQVNRQVKLCEPHCPKCLKKKIDFWEEILVQYYRYDSTAKKKFKLVEKHFKGFLSFDIQTYINFIDGNIKC